MYLFNIYYYYNYSLGNKPLPYRINTDICFKLFVKDLFYFIRYLAKRWWIYSSFEATRSKCEGCDGHRITETPSVQRLWRYCTRREAPDPSRINIWSWWFLIRWRFQPCETSHSGRKCLHCPSAQVDDVPYWKLIKLIKI